jgi:uncharacterized caspase-like protein
MRRALLVGIDDYPNAPLAGCVADADTMRRLLSTHEDGSPNFDCRLLAAPPSNIARANLKREVDQLFQHEADVALLYFSGHGTENNLGGYLVTPDATRYDEGVPMEGILTLANQSPVHEVVIILDCCHSGAFGQVMAIDNKNAIAHLREGVSVLTASRATQPAIEAGGSGVFTSLVANALDGGAADVVGNVTVAAIYAYVDQALGPWDQRPLFKAHVSRLTSLRRCQPAVPAVTLRRLPQWFPTPDAELPLDPSYEPDAEPCHQEHQAAFAELQKCRAAKLVEPVGEEHMYYAALRSKSCRLTPLGWHYWRLANEGRI